MLYKEGFCALKEGVECWQLGFELSNERLASCMVGVADPLAAEFWAEKWEDQIMLKHFFCNVRDKKYLEIGAYDGVLASNTLFFEREMGWSGILIEPQPTTSQKLKQNRGGNPRNVILAEAACSADAGGQLEMHGDDFLGAAVEDLQALEIRERWPEKYTGKYMVPCEPLSDMISKAGLTKLELLVLDVEGSELLVLETFDWHVQVCVWLVEMDGFNPEKDQAVESLLVENGYVRSPVQFWKLDITAEYGTPPNAGGVNVAFVHPDLESCLQ